MIKETHLFPRRSLTVFYLCFNQWDLIANSLLNLASVLSTDYKSSVKVVICDDYSDHDYSENLLLRLDRYSELRVQIYRNNVNLGPGPSRNFLLSICSSTHFCFVDGDDEISAAAIHEFFQAPSGFEIYQFPVLIGSRFLSSAASSPRPLNLHWLHPRAAPSTGSQKMLFTSWSRIVSSDFARKYSYRYSDSRRYEDILPYAICSIYAHSIKFCHEPLIRASMSLASGSRSVKSEFYRYLLQSLRSLWGFGFPPASFVFLIKLTMQSVRSVLISYLRSFYHRKLTAVFRK